MTVQGNSKDHVLKLEKNIYGQKQAGRVWNSYLMDKLMSIRFTPSLIDDCVFFRDDVIFMAYVDDGIFLGNDASKLTDAICNIQNSGLNIEEWQPPIQQKKVPEPEIHTMREEGCATIVMHFQWHLSLQKGG
jgi:hypothetical protein